MPIPISMLMGSSVYLWAIGILLIIIIIESIALYIIVKRNKKSFCGTAENYFTGRPEQQIAARQLARQRQGASIQQGSNMGEMDLQHDLY